MLQGDMLNLCPGVAAHRLFVLRCGYMVSSYVSGSVLFVLIQGHLSVGRGEADDHPRSEGAHVSSWDVYLPNVGDDSMGSVPSSNTRKSERVIK